MNKLKLLLLFSFITLITFSQSHIATSNAQYAIYNHNQRKIVRDNFDNIYVVFLDWMQPSYFIKGIKFDRQTGFWSDPFIITEGGGPTLAISDGDSSMIHLVYHSMDSLKKIKYIHSKDFINWEEAIILNEENKISDSPIADIDSLGVLNVFWRQSNPNTTNSLIYAKVSEGVVLERKLICTKDEINDYAIANHLQYVTNDLVFGIGFNQDSVEFFHSIDGMNTFDTLYAAIGSQPGITCNSSYGIEEDCIIRLLYVDTASYLMEADIWPYSTTPYIGQIPVGKVDYYCVDNLSPPIGFSFIFQYENWVHHAFSYGVEWNWCSIMETSYGTGNIYSSVAYKHFNFEFVDYVWMAGVEDFREIFYMRDDKHIWTDINEDAEIGKGFSITAGPNPFSDQIGINVVTENKNEIPLIQIYNTSSILVRQFSFNAVNPDGYSLSWDGKSETGEKLTAGVYIIVCSVGNKRTARKIVFQL